MTSTIIGLFDERGEARKVVSELEQHGFARENIQCVEPGTEMGITSASSPGWAGAESADIGARGEGGLEDTLRTYGLPDDMAHQYAEGVQHGGTLVAVRAPDEQADEAANILDRYHPVDIDERARHWEEGEVTDTSAAAAVPPVQPEPTREGTMPPTEARTGEKLGEEQRIPVVEEQVDVGKRRVESGGVRVYSHVVKEPVEKEVELKEEHIDVERRKVDRPVTDTEAAFQERTIEARESREEPVISKEARIIEEIVISTETTSHTEQVRDTARHTEVDVERAGEERPDYARSETHEAAGGERPDYARTEYDTADREHFGTAFVGEDFTYEQAQPAYRFGHNLAENEQYRGREWVEIEPEAQRMFELRNPGKWERFKMAVKHGYERTREHLR